jgi:hypothetical protein
MDTKISFLKDHADTVAIIGVNIAIAAILLSICLTNMSNISELNSRMDANISSANSRMDQLHVMFYDLLKEGRK